MRRGNFRKRKFNRKRKSTYKIFFLVLVGMTVGFAAINTTLQLIGTLNIAKTTWNIHWENPTKTGGVTATTDVHLKQNDNTTVEYSVNLANQGDYYEFTVDAKNDGTIDAMITGIENKVYENNVEIQKPDYLDFIVTYSNGMAIDFDQKLSAGNFETYKVKVMYKTGLTADQLPTSNRNLKFTFKVTYMQADENAKSLRFEDESWETIVANVHNGTIPAFYTVGSTKEIEMDLDGDGTTETYHLRIANNSTPTVCSTPGYSQTACGFVLEFVEVLKPANTDYRQINTNGTNAGGWRETTQVVYLNGEFYNKIPETIRNAIIPTYPIVSSSGSANGISNDITESDTTINKIYNLAAREIGWDITYDNKRNVNTHTRTLDYYDGNNNVDATRIKKNLQGTVMSWWTRSAQSIGTDQFYIAQVNGTSFPAGSTSIQYGISPAFRIG